MKIDNSMRARCCVARFNYHDNSHLRMAGAAHLDDDTGIRKPTLTEAIMNPLVELHVYGQSFWYDNIRRKCLYDETIQTLIDSDGFTRHDSNPSI